MFYYLTGALKRRLIVELRDSFSRHPIYSKVVPYIQNRFSFSERPQMGIVVQGSSSNKVQWAPDNFVGTVTSHVMLAHVGQPTYPLEWVREDLKVVSERGMPTLPGMYYIEILEAPTTSEDYGSFAMDPLLTSTDEAVLVFQSGVETEGQLQQVPRIDTLRLWENGRVLLNQGTDYDVSATGRITFLRTFLPNTRITADYRYVVDSIGPVPFRWNSADFETLPGVVLAFGKRAKKGDKVAVVVYQDRVATAQAFGGKFEANFELTIIARDTTQMEEMADMAIMYLWGEKRSLLVNEGIEILDVSMGGESEELADEAGNFFYQANLSLSMRADWEIHVPLPLTISQALQTKTDGSSGIQVVTAGDLFFQTHPLVTDRNNDFERIT